MIEVPDTDASDAEILEYLRAMRQERDRQPSDGRREPIDAWPARFTEPIGLDADGSIRVIREGDDERPRKSPDQPDE